jgi:DNA-binding IclR family transcriptional regulator
MELKTIEKALMVFKCFAEGAATLGSTELAVKLGTNKATMSRVLTTLKKHEFLERDSHTRRYRIGPAMVEMARAVYRILDGPVVAVAGPYADALRDETGERVHVEVIMGNNIYLAHIADSPNPISLKIDLGDQVMPHAHAGAKVIIAHSEPEIVENWLSRDFIRYTENTIMDVAKLRKIYQQIRQEGVAYDFGEHYDEVNAVAAPIFNHKDEPVASLIVVVPSYRLGEKWDGHLVLQLKKTANTISSRLHSSRFIEQEEYALVE